MRISVELFSLLFLVRINAVFTNFTNKKVLKGGKKKTLVNIKFRLVTDKSAS